MTKSAIRKGMDFQMRNYKDKSVVPGGYIDYINSFSVDLSGDTVSATAGSNGDDVVGFQNPLKGTIKIETQILPQELVAIAAGDLETASSSGMEHAFRETVKCATENKLTLANTPISGTVYVYKKDDDTNTPLPVTVAGSESKDITVTGATAGTEYTVWYYSAPATGTKGVLFSNESYMPYYIIDGITYWSIEGGGREFEYAHAFKAQPKKAYAVTYKGGTGDPASFTIEFNLYADDDGKVYNSDRVPEA